ncbi:hypothetical protein [Natrinema salaciae]|uniref:Uncharacterized protein n=1 Tax=Natrinema salaciae TaxID=1186196 RepID=A0A1H9KDR2_9EURY|nr:hypothetical protein [Natrinema salaciae]SEQ97222.1 hypothetical protein SAMN04489841_2891 [Natrinema salaciae]
MAEHQYWLVAELTAGGDPAVVLETGLNHEWARDGQQIEDSVVLFGEYHSAPVSELRAVSDHIDRLVWVASREGGGGATVSEYYERFDKSTDPTDELRSTPGRWWYGEHFDYYRMRYGIHAAV